jgi:hypothetical protein
MRVRAPVIGNLGLGVTVPVKSYYLFLDPVTKFIDPVFAKISPKRSFSIIPFWACFHEKWVYKYGHRIHISAYQQLPEISIQLKIRSMKTVFCEKETYRQCYVLTMIIYLHILFFLFVAINIHLFILFIIYFFLL